MSNSSFQFSNFRFLFLFNLNFQIIFFRSASNRPVACDLVFGNNGRNWNVEEYSPFEDFPFDDFPFEYFPFEDFPFEDFPI